MNRKTADNIIKMLGGRVEGHGFPMYRAVRSLDSKAKPLKYTSRWLDMRKDLSFAKKPDIIEETTYEDCVFWTIKPKGVIVFTLWEGDLLYGEPTHERCQFTVREVPTRLIKDILEARLRRLAARHEDEEEQERRRARRKEIYRNLMSNARGVKRTVS